MAQAAPSGLSFPRCFYGDADSTRSAWQAILDRGWHAGAWGSLLDELDSASVDELPGLIILREEECAGERSETHWRINWVAQLWSLNWPKSNRESESVRSRQRRLIIEGMQHHWFAFAMLDLELSTPALFADRDEASSFGMDMLLAFVDWLPEIMLLAPRFAFTWAVPTPYYDDVLEGNRWMTVWRIILGLVQRYNPAFSVTEAERLALAEASEQPDVVGLLLDRGILETSGSRYRLRHR